MGDLTVREVLVGFTEAYPEDIFPTPPDADQATDATAAHVLREVAVPIVEMALAEIDRLRARIEIAYEDGYDASELDRDLMLPVEGQDG